jgi:integrase
VFCTALGTPLGARNVERRGLGREADLAGLNPEELPRLRVHDLRHTFPSHLIVDLRLDVAQVSRILGHARPSITLDVYTPPLRPCGARGRHSRADGEKRVRKPSQLGRGLSS